MTAQPLWTLDAMAQAMSAERAGALPVSVNGISIDSRSVAAGDAFFAIQGDNRAGHEFVAAALKGGASVAVVSNDWHSSDIGNAPMLRVPDVLEGLRALARAARARLDANVIGVTGSVGKTGTKEAQVALGSNGGRMRRSPPTTIIGASCLPRAVPADALRRTRDGMNHAGEIEPLSRQARPHVAIITTVEPVHLEFFLGRSHRRCQGRDLRGLGPAALR